MYMEPKVNLKFILNTTESQHRIDQNGTVVAAIHHFYDYSIHVKFDEILDEKIVKGIKTPAAPNDEELEIFNDP